MPPSESANCRFGNLRQHRRPDQVGGGLHDVHRLSVIITSIGASAAVIDDLRRRADVQADDRCPRPRTPARTGPSGRCGSSGSRASSGFSENVTAWQPFSATRRTSSAISFGIPDRRDRQRDEAAGVRAAPLVDVPVVVGLQQRERRGPCRRRAANSWPQKPGNDGKHIEPSTPLAFMSRTRSWMS